MFSWDEGVALSDHSCCGEDEGWQEGEIFSVVVRFFLVTFLDETLGHCLFSFAVSWQTKDSTKDLFFSVRDICRLLLWITQCWVWLFRSKRSYNSLKKWGKLSSYAIHVLLRWCRHSWRVFWLFVHLKIDIFTTTRWKFMSWNYSNQYILFLEVLVELAE